MVVLKKVDNSIFTCPPPVHLLSTLPVVVLVVLALVVVLLMLCAADCTGHAPCHWLCATCQCGPPVAQVPPNVMVIDQQAHMLLHKVDVLGDSISIPPKGKVELSLAELELKKAIADAVQIAKLELNPHLHHVVAGNVKQMRYPSNHNTLCLGLVEDGVSCVVDDEPYLQLNKELVMRSETQN